MIGTKLGGRYEIRSEIGRGGMGVVYLARDPKLDRDVAIKVLRGSAIDRKVEERFRREARTVARLDHPAIVVAHDIGEQDGSLFFVMPFVPGVSLRTLIQHGSLKLVEAVQIGISLADGLDYSHSRGVTHRDIKPENVMVDRAEGGSFRVRILDFGIAASDRTERDTDTGEIVGTIGYLSPEQIEGREPDGRSDLYSLGTVLYECIAGQPPFTGDPQSVLYRIVHERPTPPSAFGAAVDAELEQILLGCLEKEPERRPARGRDLAEALTQYAAGLSSDQMNRALQATGSSVALRRRPVAALVGRRREVDEMQARLNAAVAGECQFVAVGGEPGVGKTRLLDEIEALARARRIPVLHGRFVEADGTFSYQAYCDAILEAFRAHGAKGVPPATEFVDLASDLLSLFPVLGEVAELRGWTTGSHGIEAVRGGDRTYVFELLARTFARIGAGKPMVLMFEELHQADVSIEALAYLVRRLGPTPTLVVATWRTTEVERGHPLRKMLESFDGDRRFSGILLTPLAASEHRQFLGTLLPGGAEDEVAARLFEATEGNPFFTRELVRALVDAGGLVTDDLGAWTLATSEGISAQALPATIQQTVARRIERLPESLRETLAIASVLGRSFEVADLEAISQTPAEVADAVDRLEQAEFLEADRKGSRLAFVSGIVRDVLYRGLPRRRRRLLHRRYAEELEKRHAGRLERVYAELVRHFSEADEAPRVVEYGFRLARKSLSAFLPEEAERAARAVILALEEEDGGDRAALGEAHQLLASAQRMLGNIDLALRESEESVKIFVREGLPVRAAAAAAFAAETAWMARRVEIAARWIDQGLGIARGGGDRDDLRRLLSLAGTVANLRGRHQEARAFSEEATRLSPEAPSAEEVPSGGTLVVALSQPIVASDPGAMRKSDEQEVLANVFETLVVADLAGNPMASLCDRWDVLDDGRRFRFLLRPAARLNDGSPLGAAEVKRSIERTIRVAPDNIPTAFRAIGGIARFLSGEGDSLEGVSVLSKTEFEIRLDEPLPIYPSLLTDPRTAIAVERPRTGGGTTLVGTGPFTIRETGPDRTILDRAPDPWKGTPARLSSLEFRAGLGAADIAAGFRAGKYDIARDLLPGALEEILRDRHLRATLVEAPRKNIHFAVFASGSRVASRADVREAMCQAVRVQDLVRETLGRFAEPAEGLLPPGILGHDPGRRRRPEPLERIARRLREAGLALPLRLVAVIHPAFQDRYAPLARALVEAWRQIGIEVEEIRPEMDAFLDLWNEPSGIDLMLTRWFADYDDPDDFTYGLFHSKAGVFRHYLSSDELDALVDEARTESRPAMRERLYRRIEGNLIDGCHILPLFHDIDYRVSGPRVRGIRLRSRAPYVNYSEIGCLDDTSSGAVSRIGGGVLQVPISGRVVDFDPSICSLVAECEVVPAVFETLTRETDDARIEPWLAEAFEAEDGGRRFRFRLREDVRFHDGRRLSARDVRWSYERLLQNRASQARWPLMPVTGARRILDEETRELEGFRILSAREFVIELDEPVSFFPALLAYASAGIVPDGSDPAGGRERPIGTGPFRVADFRPGERATLEPHPAYWRRGLPKADGIVFHFGIPPREIEAGFREGRYSLAWDLVPGAVDALRLEPGIAGNYREIPRLGTYFVILNVRSGPLSDERLRHRLVSSVDVPALVRRMHGRLAIPAEGLIPPGLLGYEPSRRPAAASERRAGGDRPVELRAVVNSAYEGAYAGLLGQLLGAFCGAGFNTKMLDFREENMPERRNEAIDLVFGRWIADYPDADTFVHGLLHSEKGLFSRFVGMPEIDRLIDWGRTETNAAARHQIYREIEEILRQRAFLIPLFHEQAYRFARPEVQSFEITFCDPVVAYERAWIRKA